MPRLNLKYEIQFKDLYTLKTLEKLERLFQETLPQELKDYLQQVRQAEEVEPLQESRFLLEMAPYLETFLVDLFGIQDHFEKAYEAHLDYDPVIKCKVNFVRRQVVIKKENAISTLQAMHTLDYLKSIVLPFTEQKFSQTILMWLETPEKFKKQLENAEILARWGCLTQEGQLFFKEWILFDLPAKIDPADLIPLKKEKFQEQTESQYGRHDFHERSGFECTDPGVRLNEAQDHAAYCLWCHKREKDSCSKGLKDPKTGKAQISSLGIELEGCPLGQKISEMNFLKSHGHFLAAVAVAMVDNPLLAATGHRICNECSKACIYQKQEPVDIPKVETQSFESVLNLPWGVEIYALLTRWNPLNRRAPLPKPPTDHKVLVAGMGPAGFTLAHYLLREGHTVVGIDGLKIEPFEERFISNPIHTMEDLRENLSDRIIAGFGGVAEYGITVRWDKNNLKIIRLLLERHPHFRLYGGIRLGSNITLDQAYEMGFDHVALCLGAGRPNVLPIKNGLAKGVRLAGDFLMALQLTGAFKKDALANLQVRLPAMIVGGGLTAIDTATEVMAYYPLQVKRFAERYAELLEHQGSVEKIRQGWENEDQLIADEFLEHAAEVSLEEEAAARQSRQPNMRRLIQKWGGVRVLYRKDLTNAPSYKLNHMEVSRALQEGITLIPDQAPLEIEVDEFEVAKGILCKNVQTDKETLFPAKSIFIAAGIYPNITLATEYPAHLKVAGHYFQAIDSSGIPISLEELRKSEKPHFLLASETYKNRLSFFGDLHPRFEGSVVRAKASAQKGYPIISQVLQRVSVSPLSRQDFFQKLDDLLEARIVDVQRLAPNILEVTVKSQQAAYNFKPGQFYRLQNFETFAPTQNGIKLLMEGIALTGAQVEIDKGFISLIILEMGTSSDLCGFLKIGEPIVLMGPTGAPTEIPAFETVLLVGGRLGNAVLFSIGKAMRAKGCRVIYFAAYKSADHVFKREHIEKAADNVIWCAESGEITPRRSTDTFFSGNIVEALKAWHKKQILGDNMGPGQIDRVLTIGSDLMMKAVYDLRSLFPAHAKMIGSINSPMQCMMKEICAQCLQKHRNPLTGEESYVFSCVNQDQHLDFVDFNHLNNRLTQNRLSEKLTRAWLEKKMGK